MNSELNSILALLAQKGCVVLTGAGISQESGIPTFREAQTGLWAKYDPHKLATSEGFIADPALVWSWYDYRRNLLAKAKPNAGHLAIAELESLVSELALITQNVDGLHALAGSKNLLELHGNINRFKCFGSAHKASNVELGLKEPPLCFCGQPLRPDVVWFGESLDSGILNAAYAYAKRSCVFIVVGTSGVVRPAASLPYIAKEVGSRVIEINPEESGITPIADIYLKGSAASRLPELVSLLKSLN